MKREQVLTQLEPMRGFEVRPVVHTPQTRVLVEPEAVILRPGGGRHSLSFSEGGVKSLASFLGVPTDLAKQVHPDTFGRVATELLERKQAYTVTMKDHQVVSVQRAGSHPMDAERVLSTIERAIPVEDFNRVLMDPRTFTVTLDVAGDRRLPVFKGDLIQGGASVTFSPMGTIKPAVQSYVLRLICTNGATTMDVLQEFQYQRGQGGDSGGHNQGDVWSFLRHSVKLAYNAAEGITTQWQKLQERAISSTDRPAILEALIKRAHLTGRLADAVRAQALREPPETEYQMLNLITWATSHILVEPRDVQLARRATAEYISETHHARICPTCHR